MIGWLKKLIARREFTERRTWTLSFENSEDGKVAEYGEFYGTYDAAADELRMRHLRRLLKMWELPGASRSPVSGSPRIVPLERAEGDSP